VEQDFTRIAKITPVSPVIPRDVPSVVLTKLFVKVNALAIITYMKMSAYLNVLSNNMAKMDNAINVINLV